MAMLAARIRIIVLFGPLGIFGNKIDPGTTQRRILEVFDHIAHGRI
jgi:hypothetical protein